MPTMIRTNTPTQPRTMPAKTRSPHTLPPARAKKARGRGSPSATPPPLTRLSTMSAPGQQRLPLIVDLADLDLDLLDNGRRERRVEQVGGIALPLVRRPP